MTSLIQQQQELVAQVLEHSNRIDSIVRETVILVPDVLYENKQIREKMIKIFELEQRILLETIFPIEESENE